MTQRRNITKSGIFNHQRRTQKGQIAIFVVLIFQVLFVFFALALNVALVVHDKINLQNSADLAALYGAQKQAEVLNVLAHINFQMRQNFKLLTWRYRVLGSITYVGDLRNTINPVDGEFWCPYAMNNAGIPIDGAFKYCNPPYASQCNDRIYPDYCDANYFVCISGAIWQGRGPTIDTRTNHCKHVNTTLQAVEPFPIVPGNPLMGAVTSLLDSTIALGDRLVAKCKYEGLYNWLITQMFLGHFRLDQKDRKVMIRKIYENTLMAGKDLDGNSIREGVLKTFKKNLTYTNKKNFQDGTLEAFHSPEGVGFKDFFTSIDIYPVLEYLDFIDLNQCGNSERTPHYVLPRMIKKPPNPIIPTNPAEFPDSYQQFMRDWMSLFALSTEGGTPITPGLPSGPPLVFFTEDQLLAPLTLGYERTDKTFHYGVSVTVDYNTAFPLFFPGMSGDANLQLKANSFTKPFGSRIGPKREALDPRIKPILIDPTNTNFATGNAYFMKPNYSRYPEDQWGLIHKDIHEKHYLKKFMDTIDPAPIPWPYDIIYFSYLHGGDPLAYDERAEHYLFLRMMELMAVAPDLYDMTYYSPLNHYMTAYFPRICHLLTGSDCPPDNRAISMGSVDNGGVTVEVFLRGDFGFPYTKVYSDQNKQELGVSSPLSTFYFNLGKTDFDVPELGAQKDKFINPLVAPWLIKDPAHFLTAWVPQTAMDRYDNYGFPTEIFGKCRTVARDEDPVSSGCVTGGRAGYSVKLISCELASELQPELTIPCSD